MLVQECWMTVLPTSVASAETSTRPSTSIINTPLDTWPSTDRDSLPPGSPSSAKARPRSSSKRQTQNTSRWVFAGSHQKKPACRIPPTTLGSRLKTTKRWPVGLYELCFLLLQRPQPHGADRRGTLRAQILFFPAMAAKSPFSSGMDVDKPEEKPWYQFW